MLLLLRLPILRLLLLHCPSCFCRCRCRCCCCCCCRRRCRLCRRHGLDSYDGHQCCCCFDRAWGGGARGARWLRQLHHLHSAGRRPASGSGRFRLPDRAATDGRTTRSAAAASLGRPLRPGRAATDGRTTRPASAASHRRTSSPASCGPSSDIRPRPGVWRPRAGSLLPPTTPSSAQPHDCGGTP